MPDNELILLRAIVRALIAYFRVKKSWDNTKTELVALKKLLAEYEKDYTG